MPEGAGEGAWERYTESVTGNEFFAELINKGVPEDLAEDARKEFVRTPRRQT